MKQKTYAWKGTDAHGKLLSGETIALSHHHLKIKLKQQGITLYHAHSSCSLLSHLCHPKITTQDIMIFFRQLATLNTAGIPLLQCLTILKNGQDNIALQKLIHSLYINIEAGNLFSQGLKKHTRYFDAFTCQLIQTGEQTGTLDKILQQIADYQEHMMALKSQFKQALFYPALIITFAWMIFTAMLIFIVPKFGELFQTFPGQLPTATKAMITFSQFAREKGWIIGLGLIGCGISYIAFHPKKIDSLTALKKLLFQRLPIIKHVYIKIALTRFARNLVITLSAGIPLADALKYMTSSPPHPWLLQTINRLHSNVAAGRQLNVAMQSETCFPNLMIQMVKIGEESGNLEAMLEKIADLYQADIDQLIEKLNQTLEPLIMVILGVLIGGLIIALYLPIFKLGNVI